MRWRSDSFAFASNRVWGGARGIASLDLTFHASGATQHVFVRTDEPDDGWVYKTPALVDALLPSRPSWRRCRPAAGWKRAVFAVVFRGPSHLRASAISALLGSGASSRTCRTLRTAAADVLNELGTDLSAVGRLLWSVHARAGRRRAFLTMCDILRRLDDQTATDVLLPFAVDTCRCTLRTPVGVHRYIGPVLRQRRADHFFLYFDGFGLFQWEDVVNAEHTLWKHCIGFTDLDEALGPRNWALLGNKLYLADTGSLTEDVAAVRAVISPAAIARRRREIPEWWPGHVGAELDQYLAYIGSHIYTDAVATLWGTAAASPLHAAVGSDGTALSNAGPAFVEVPAAVPEPTCAKLPARCTTT